MSLYVDLIILGSVEFLSALFSKVLFKSLTRRTSLLHCYLFTFFCFFFLLIFTANNTQAKYIVTISTRAALQLIFNVLILTTYEQFPTEVRGTSSNLCFSFGLLAGVGLPFFEQLSSDLIVIILLIYGTAAIGALFLRETKQEEGLKNVYSEIYNEEIEDENI